MLPERRDQGEIQINRLWWPRGASRWAYGHFLATDKELYLIRQQAYYAGPGLNPLPLIINDGTLVNQVPTYLYMLPARPIAQNPATILERQLYLITLVDERYFWQERAGTVEPQDTWAALYSAIAGALGITIAGDPVHPAYLVPSKALTANYTNLPSLLDAVAESCGQRIIRTLTGSVQALNFSSAYALAEANRAMAEQKAKDAGGVFAFYPGGPNDIKALLRSSVTVTFPMGVKKCVVSYDNVANVDPLILTPPEKTVLDILEGVWTEPVTLLDLSLSQFGSESGNTASTHIIHSTAVAQFTDPDDTGPLNGVEILLLARRIATDWYLWQLGFIEMTVDGVCPLFIDGLHDWVEWRAIGDDGTLPLQGRFQTRIQRGPWSAAENFVWQGSTGIVDAELSASAKEVADGVWRYFTDDQKSVFIDKLVVNEITNLKHRGETVTVRIAVGTEADADGYYEGFLQKWDTEEAAWVDVEDADGSPVPVLVILDDDTVFTEETFYNGRIVAYSECVPVVSPSVSSSDEIFWLVVTSLTQTAGRYPALRYDLNANTATYTSSGEVCWLDTPNGEILGIGLPMYWPAKFTGVRSADGKLIYHALQWLRFARVTLGATLNFGSSATATTSDGQTITVYDDGALSSGQSVASGLKGYAHWSDLDAKWYGGTFQC